MNIICVKGRYIFINYY